MQSSKEIKPDLNELKLNSPFSSFFDKYIENAKKEITRTTKAQIKKNLLSF